MANVHFRRLQTPLCSEWHLSTIKATLHQINKVLEDSDERQSVLTSLYQALWDTLHEDFEDVDQPPSKKAKTISDEGELFRVIQLSLHSLITSARNDLTALEPKQNSQDPNVRTFHVLEETERLACRRSFEAAAALNDAGHDSSDSKNVGCDIRDHLKTWEKALELCNRALQLKEPDDEETQYFEPDVVEDLSQDFSNLTLQDQDLIIPTSPEEATRVLSEFRPSQNIPATLQTILAVKADPNIIIGTRGITPLHNIIAFARKAHVRDMRRLLLEAGATESDDMKDR